MNSKGREMNFEKALNELEQIVNKLEKGADFFCHRVTDQADYVPALFVIIVYLLSYFFAFQQFLDGCGGVCSYLFDTLYPLVYFL